MRKVNWFFRVFVFAIATLVLVASCSKDDLLTDDGFDTVIDSNSDNAEGEEGALTLYAIDGNSITKIKDYDVKNNLKSYQEDVTKHQEMWDYFTQLIPVDARGKIVEFEVIHGGGDLLGYVTPINQNDLSRWRMGLAIDATGDLSKVNLTEEFAYTAIHEFGHVLTLSDEQVDVNKDEGSCNTFHTGEGCANANSYIQKIYEIGWKDIIDEFNGVRNDRQAQNFYDKYSDRFVTDYAATNPGEDVAEVFTVFVTKDNKPTGNSIADQKVLAMYDFPELVELRQKIRTNPVIRAMVPGSWKRPKCGKGHHNHAHAAH